MPPLPLPSRQETLLDFQDTSTPVAHEAATRKIPARIGKYQILGEVARGGMGIIYRARDPMLRRTVALKVMLAGEHATEKSLRRFLREVRTAAKVRHPNIVPIHDAGQAEGQYYFTMDFIDGISFDALIRARQLKPRELVGHLLTLGKALQAAHDVGVVHRDLKPANLMLRRSDDRPFIMDFGLAKDLTAESLHSVTGDLLGTPSYMSPEQAQGLVRATDHRTDIYSLGVILYEGLTGISPFRSVSAIDTLSRIVSEEPVSPRKLAPRAVHSDLDTIILHCLEKDPKQRYQSMRELAADLEDFLQGNPIHARNTVAPLRMWRRLRRRPLALAAVLGSLGILFLAGLYFSFLAPPGIVASTRQALAAGNAERRRTALKELASRYQENQIPSSGEQKEARELFRACLDLPDQELSRIAIDASGTARDREAIPPLLQVAGDGKKTESRRALALKTATSIGGNGEEVNPEWAALVAALARDRKNPFPLRRQAAEGLGSWWGKEAREALLYLARDRTEEGPLRSAALLAMKGHVNLSDLELCKTLIALFGDEDEQVAGAASLLLKSARSGPSIFSLYGIQGYVATALERTGGVVAMNAERNRALEKFANDMEAPPGGKQPANPAAAMAEKLSDPSPEVRAAAAYDLGQLGDPRAVPPLLEHLTDTVQEVRVVAARALVELAPRAKPDLPRLRELLKHDDLLVREQAVWVLGKIYPSEAAADLAALCGPEKSGRVQAMLARSLSSCPPDQALPALQALLRQAHDDKAALASLAALAKFQEKGVPFLADGLESASGPVKKASYDALKEITGTDLGTNAAPWRAWKKPSGKL